MGSPNYPPEDRFTNSVEDAAKYERWRARDLRLLDEDDADVDRPPAQEEDDCKCSDPGCPCSGIKRGGPP